MQRQLPDVTAEAKSAAPILDVAIGESVALSFNERSFLNLLPGALQKEVTHYGDQYLLHSFRKLTLFPSDIKNPDALVIQLLTHVIRGELKEADAMLQREPSLALEENTVTDYSGRTIQGTALKMALGALDVNVHGACDLVIRSPEKDWINGEISPASKALYVFQGKKLYYIDRTKCPFTETSITEIPLTEVQQKEFEVAVLTPIIRLQIWKGEAARLSEDTLKKITTITGHIHEESMAGMIMRHLRKIPGGKVEIVKQINEQFPAGWETEEANRVKRNKEALLTVFDEIKAAKTNALVDAATKRFWDYLEKENDPKNMIKTGKHFNEQMLLDALHLYAKYYNKDTYYKNTILWQRVIGGIQRYVPANMAQGLAQGAHFIINEGEKLKRSLTFRREDPTVFFTFNKYFYPLDAVRGSNLGEAYAVHRERGCVTMWFEPEKWSALQKLCEAKTTSLADLCNAHKRATTFVAASNRLK